MNDNNVCESDIPHNEDLMNQFFLSLNIPRPSLDAEQLQQTNVRVKKILIREYKLSGYPPITDRLMSKYADVARACCCYFSGVSPVSFLEYEKMACKKLETRRREKDSGGK